MAVDWSSRALTMGGGEGGHPQAPALPPASELPLRCPIPAGVSAAMDQSSRALLQGEVKEAAAAVDQSSP